MSYEQAMKHSRNHRKDRFHQQCSGYGGNGDSQPITVEQGKKIEKESWAKLLEAAKNFPFPAHIFQSGWFWRISDKPNLFSTEVKSYEELLKFGEECL